MANYFNLTYDADYPTGPAIHLNDTDGYQLVNGLNVDIALKPSSGFTPANYKLWNINGATTSGEVSWSAWTTNTSGVLIEQSSVQYVYSQFKNAGGGIESATSSGIEFNWVSPTIHNSVAWKDNFQSLQYESANLAVLRNVGQNIDVDLDKTNINGLRFSGKDFSDLQISGDTIIGSSSGYLGTLLSADASNKISITKVFTGDQTPMITVDTGSGFETLTTFSGTIKSTVTGDYTGRIENIVWTAGTKTLTFDILRFSTYGFCTINQLEFTNTSMEGGYDGDSIYLKVEVKDTNGQLVENAPVTFSGTGDVIGSFSVNPVNTDVNGVATATLNLDTVGTATYDAECDGIHTTADQLTWCLASGINFGRSMLRQADQVMHSETYDDAIVNANTSDVAEPTASGSLEDDLNVIRTLVSQMKSTASGTNWYDSMGTYFDPTDTDVGNAENKDMNLANIKGKTTDAQTIILAIDAYNSGAGFTVSGTSTGVLLTLNHDYATATDRIGLPIFTSTTNSGSYFDEWGLDRVCALSVFNVDTGNAFEDEAGNTIYAKFHDGTDFAGTGTGTDAYARFYANDVVCDLTNVSGTTPSAVLFVYPYRKAVADVADHEWHRTDFGNVFEEDIHFVTAISNLWAFTGSVDNETDPTWTYTTSGYPLESNPTDLEAGANLLNNAIDDRDYFEQNYVTDGEAITTSLDELDKALQVVEDLASGGTGAKYIEEIGADVSAGTYHAIPDNATFTPTSTSGTEGKNMDVFLNGQLLAASTGTNGANEDRDYAETTTSGVTFHTDVDQYSNVTYVIRV